MCARVCLFIDVFGLGIKQLSLSRFRIELFKKQHTLCQYTLMVNRIDRVNERGNGNRGNNLSSDTILKEILRMRFKVFFFSMWYVYIS